MSLSYERFAGLMHEYADHIAETALRKERQRPEQEQLDAAAAALRAKDTLWSAIHDHAQANLLAVEPTQLGTVLPFHRPIGSEPISELLLEASAAGVDEGLREIRGEADDLQQILPALRSAQKGEGLLALLTRGEESIERLAAAVTFAIRMEQTNQAAVELHELLASIGRASRQQADAAENEGPVP
jgi:uncharacterized protein YukE